MVERLRKEERLWPRLRWFLLGVGILKCGFYSYILSAVIGQLPSVESRQYEFSLSVWYTEFAFFWPMCIWGWTIGGLLVGFSIGNWHGNVNRMLLLKLLDAQLKQAERDMKHG